nr:14388_t:CDS:2 [Entrophospora candida]
MSSNKNNSLTVGSTRYRREVLTRHETTKDHVAASKSINPNQKKIDKISQPMGLTPSQPMGLTPSQPTGLTPSQPTGLTPSQPTGLTPSQPMDLAPSQPMGLTPSQPTGLTPSQPTGLAPSQPTGLAPSQLQDQQWADTITTTNRANII